MGSSLSATDAAAKKVEGVLAGISQIQTYQVTVGGGGGFASLLNGGSGYNTASFSITTDASADQNAVQQTLQNRLNSLSGAGTLTLSVGGGGGGFNSSGITINVQASDPLTLQQAAQQVLAAVQQVSNTINVSSNLTNAAPLIDVTVDTSKAAAHGLTAAQVGHLVREVYTGATVTNVTLNGQQENVNLFLSLPASSVQDMQNMLIPTQTGNVKLSDLATVTQTTGPTQITHIGGTRTATISATATSQNVGGVTCAIQQKLNALHLPSGVTISQGGVASSQSQAFSCLEIALLAAIVLVYLVMVGTFRSLVQPLILLVSIPFAGTGSILSILAEAHPRRLCGLISYAKSPLGNGLDCREGPLTGCVAKTLEYRQEAIVPLPTVVFYHFLPYTSFGGTAQACLFLTQDALDMVPAGFSLLLRNSLIIMQQYDNVKENLMHRGRRILLSALLLAVLAGTFRFSVTALAASTAPKITCNQWNYVNSPNPSTYGNYLSGVAAISANDVWAIGSQFNNIDNSLTLAEHYDGTQWNVVSVPAPAGAVEEDLFNIIAVSTSDVWAVGYYFDNSYISHTLIEQWNGSAWSIIPSPDQGSSGSSLFGVAAISATNIWAVGGYQDSSFNNYTLIEQWNGTTWSIVASPNGSGQSNNLDSVAAISSSDVWAVGYESTATLTEQWNGTVWKIVPSASRKGSSNNLNSVVSVSSKSLWAAGDSINSTTGQYSTLMEKWNGSAWKIVASPTPASTSNLTLSGIAALSSSNIWAVGWDQNTQGKTKPLIEHWNGSGWSLVPGVKVGSFQYELVGINRVPGTSTLWTVGLLFGNTGYQTLTEYYC